MTARTRRPPPAQPPSPHAALPGAPLLAWPFDLMRTCFANAAMAGLVGRSIVASGQLERALDGLERRLLGPLARRR